MSSTIAAKRILVVGHPHSGKLSFVQRLTGSLPANLPSLPIDDSGGRDRSGRGESQSGHGGLTHSWRLTTKYYDTEIDIWIDECAPADTASFCASYAGPEAAEVREAIGVLVVCFDRTEGQEVARKWFEGVRQIADRISPEPLLLAVGRGPPLPRSDIETETKTAAERGPRDADASTMEDAEWDDLCTDEGFEYIDLFASGTNAFSEHIGISRARESIASQDWSQTLSDPDPDTLLAKFMEEDASLNERLMGLDENETGVSVDEASVEELEGMMQRILDAREHLQDLDPEEKKRQAAKLVAEIMKV